jgi:excisionase family DNA binding protein
MEDKRLLTRKEAAAYLGVKVQTLAAWAVTGRYRLPVVKVGRSVRYRVADLEAWLAARTMNAGQASPEPIPAAGERGV